MQVLIWKDRQVWQRVVEVWVGSKQRRYHRARDGKIRRRYGDGTVQIVVFILSVVLSTQKESSQVFVLIIVGLGYRFVQIMN